MFASNGQCGHLARSTTRRLEGEKAQSGGGQVLYHFYSRMTRAKLLWYTLDFH